MPSSLGSEEPETLAPLDGVTRKVTVFAPETAADAVRQSLVAAGAGEVGDYDGCSFTAEGTGRFVPRAGARPAVGAVGEPEAVAEVRIEAVVPSWAVGAVRRAVAAAHPYQTPAVDVVALEGPATRHGYGVVGQLDAPEPLENFLGRVRRALGAGALRYVGDDRPMIERVAVCGGSGLSFLPHALRAGADAFVTSDVTYHRWFEALDADGPPAPGAGRRRPLRDRGRHGTPDRRPARGRAPRAGRRRYPAPDLARADVRGVTPAAPRVGATSRT